MPELLTHYLNALGIAKPGTLGWLVVVFSFVLAWVVTWRFIPRLRAFALQVGWTDQPNERRLNKEPLPNAGGLGIYAGVLAALILATLLRPIVIDAVKIELLAILLGGSLLVLVGFIDDQFDLPPLARLSVQTLAALLLVASGIRIEVSFGGSLAGVISVLLTLLWIVGITNAVNLMDGVDGLAGGVSFITAASLLAVSAQFEERAAATLILAALGGAALGFLRHNFFPSRIIMGDGGAYFFGFVLAASSILGSVKITTLFALGPTVLFLLLPIADTIQVVIRRVLARKNPLVSPGKDHLHHHLLALGLSQRYAAVVLWGLSLAGNVVAMVVQGISTTVVITTTLGIMALLGFTVWRRIRAAWRGR